MHRSVDAGGAFVGGEEEGANRWRTEAEALMAVVAEGKGCGTGRTRMRPIPDASMEKLMSFIKSFVKLGIFLHERA